MNGQSTGASVERGEGVSVGELHMADLRHKQTRFRQKIQKQSEIQYAPP